jgi:Phosphotransferase enzyme family
LLERDGSRTGLVSALPVVADAASRPAELETSARELWRHVSPPGSTRFQVPASAASRRRLRSRVRTLPPGASVVLSCAGLGARRRCRLFALEAGIEILREYIAVPSVESPTCYIEDSRSTLTYFFTELLTLPKGGAVIAAPLQTMKTIARTFFPATLVGSVAPIRIILGRVSVGRSVRAAYPGLAEPPSSAAPFDVPGMRSLVLALSKDPNAKITVLLIPDDGGRPTLAIKLPTTAAARATIAAERGILISLRARLPDVVLTTIPSLEHKLGFPKQSLVTSALPGSPMTTRYHAWRHLGNPAAVRADFQTVGEWLGGLQSAVTGPRQPVDMDGGMTSLLRHRFSEDPRLDESMAALGAVYARLRTVSTPRTAVHGDFWFGNVLLTGEKVSGVIDWEAGSACGEPIRDLVRFALTYSLYLDRHSRVGHRVSGHPGLRVGEWGAGIAWAVDGKGWFPDLVRDFVKGGLAEVAATADHFEFARLHWQLFGRLSSQVPAFSAAAVSQPSR